MADGKFAHLQPIIKRFYHWLATRPDWQVILFFIAATIILRVLALHIYPSWPRSLDCNAHLLGAHTFAEGRLTNPASPWHQLSVLDYPTTMMKYQPAMALFMALGIKLFGHPQWGVALCMALAIGASYWALRGWVGKTYAFTGSLLLMLIFRAPHYYVVNYDGGSHIMLAGFLMFGAYPRVLFQHRYRVIIIGLLGAALALLGRPYEGGALLLGLSLCGFFTIFRWFDAEQRSRCLRVIWLPTILILGAYASFQLYYNHRVTGDAFQFPYTYYHKKFDVANMFVFEKPNYANYSIEWLRWYNRIEEGIADKDKLKHLHWPTSYALLWTLGNGTWTSGFGRYADMFVDRHLSYLVAVIFHFPLVYMLTVSVKDRNMRRRYLPLLGGAVFAWTAFALGAWSLPHYYAPYFVAIYLSLFVVMHDIKFHPAITTSLTLFAIILFITTGGRMI